MLNRNAGLPLLGGRPIAASSHEKKRTEIGGGKWKRSEIFEFASESQSRNAGDTHDNET